MVLDATVQYKILVKNLIPEDFQSGFTNGQGVDQQLERASNVTEEEEIMKIASIPSYLIYDGFDKDLDSAMVYERLMDSTEKSYMHSHSLTFLHS